MPLAALAVVALLALPAAALAGGPPLEGSFGERFVIKDEPKPAPDVAFSDRDGGSVTLQDFKGKVVLLNFWATWCAPCVEEMPTLDALESDLRDEGLKVLAVSEDAGGRDQVEPFLREKLNLDNLEIFLDPKGRLGGAMGLRGMPTTFLIDARGNVVGGMEGPADWNGEPVKKLIRYYLDRAREEGVTQTSG
jgi:thiol-disulfide isomerase/thioredoxin